MSLVKVSGNASGTGTLTIAAPNTNTDYTLTLPTNTGTLLSTKSAGTVLQVVNATYSTATTNTTTTYAATGLSASITPTSASNKILVLVNQGDTGANQANNGGGFRLYRAGSSILQFSSQEGYVQMGIGTLNIVQGPSTAYLDSPATTSSVTYATYFNCAGGTSMTVQRDGTASTITLMEIAV